MVPLWMLELDGLDELDTPGTPGTPDEEEVPGAGLEEDLPSVPAELDDSAGLASQVSTTAPSKRAQDSALISVHLPFTRQDTKPEETEDEDEPGPGSGSDSEELDRLGSDGSGGGGIWMSDEHPARIRTPRANRLATNFMGKSP
jgi:hypothetical protein